MRTLLAIENSTDKWKIFTNEYIFVIIIMLIILLKLTWIYNNYRKFLSERRISMLDVIIPSSEYNNDIHAVEFINYLQENQEELKLEDATVYYKFPIFREFDEIKRAPSFFLISPVYGIIIFNNFLIMKNKICT